MSKRIIVYSAAMCGDCQALKAYMKREGIAHETRDIQENPAYKQELEARTGKAGVPYLVIEGEWVRGYVPGQPFSEEFARSLFA